MTEVPPTLNTVTSEPGGRVRGNRRRARSNIPGERASTLPPVREGEIVFRLFPTNETLRVWGRKHHFKVKDRGPVPKEVREHFMKWNMWSVRIISIQPPGANEPSAYYQVMQGLYERRLTTDPDMVRRELGPELYALLKQVKT